MEGMQKKQISMPFTILALIFCMIFVIDVYLELKIISLFGFAFTSGILLIAIIYVISDCLVEVYGFKRTQQVIWLTFIMQIAVMLLFQIACWLPAAKFWEGEIHFQYIFGLTSARIAISGIIAFLVGSTVNAWIMSVMKVKQQGKHFKVRAFVSTIFGEYIDTFTFYMCAFTGLMPMKELISIILVQATLKIMVEGMILPITHKIVNFLKKYDGIDVYDYGLVSSTKASGI